MTNGIEKYEIAISAELRREGGLWIERKSFFAFREENHPALKGTPP